jgi:DNA polymerase-4
MQKIIHADCDCFFAAVEMRDNPLLRDKPIAVGGAADKRGVVATCNYHARAYGVRSAMPTAQAQKLCPELILCSSRMPVYQSIAQTIREIFLQLTDQVEVVSIDEAYLDVSSVTEFQGSATLMAKWLKQQVLEKTGVTISTGISVNKFLAKIASDWQKPDGLFVIHPNEVESFILNLTVGKIPGVGAVTEEKLAKKGIVNCAQLQQISLSQLIEWFGKFGLILYQRSRGEDYRVVITERIRKSVSVERTFTDNLRQLDDIESALDMMLPTLEQRFQPFSQRKVKSVFLKLRFADFSTTTVESAMSGSLLLGSKMCLDRSLFIPLLHEALRRGQCNIRLLGVGLRLMEPACSAEQLSLF